LTIKGRGFKLPSELNSTMGIIRSFILKKLLVAINKLKTSPPKVFIFYFSKI